jgi:hypothetical protein
MHRESVIRSGAKRPLVVGDRLDTDIEGAHAGGVDSLLVLTGVTTVEALLAAPPHHRPTYVARDLRGLLLPHPEVTRDGSLAHCGGWTASAAGESLTLTGEGDPVDALRALCSAGWASPGSDASKALASLDL